MGVLAIEYPAGFRFGVHRKAVVQQVASQAAVALRLLEKRQLRDQLARRQAPAGAGGLLSEISAELRAPLESILRRVQAWSPNVGDGAAAEIPALADDAQQALAIVERLGTLLRHPDAGVAGPAPSAPSSRRIPGEARRLTALIVEPDADASRKLVLMLSGRGHRAVPVASAEEAVDLAQRLRFGLIFCAARLPGAPWTEFLHRLKHRTSAFVLMADKTESEPTRITPGEEARVLTKPLRQEEFDRLLESLEAALPPDGR